MTDAIILLYTGCIAGATMHLYLRLKVAERKIEALKMSLLVRRNI
jgi:hypothetical protein